MDEFPFTWISLTPIPPRLQVLWNRLSSLRRGEELTPEEFAELKSLTVGYVFPVITSTPDYYAAAG